VQEAPRLSPARRWTLTVVVEANPCSINDSTATSTILRRVAARWSSRDVTLSLRDLASALTDARTITMTSGACRDSLGGFHVAG
jgi:hypothetical protein